jgi:hypothetical protein
VGWLFLRQAFHLPELSQIEGQHFSDVHVREGIALKSISPRSILYKAQQRTAFPLLNEPFSPTGVVVIRRQAVANVRLSMSVG